MKLKPNNLEQDVSVSVHIFNIKVSITAVRKRSSIWNKYWAMKMIDQKETKLLIDGMDVDMESTDVYLKVEWIISKQERNKQVISFSG